MKTLLKRILAASFLLQPLRRALSWLTTAVSRRGRSYAERQKTRSAFFRALFSVMGHLAKADGRVSEAEIAYATRTMELMGLKGERRREAIALFEQGKRSDFVLDATLVQFRRDCHASHNMSQLFLEVLLQLAHADGRMHGEARQILNHTFDLLGFSPRNFERMAAEAAATAEFSRRRPEGAPGEERRSGQERRERPRPDSQQRRRSSQKPDPRGEFQRLLRPAYTVLGLRPEASDEEVKRAFHRQMREHHPDKLAAKGASEEMLRLATERTQQIKAAYDQIRAARGGLR